MEHAEDVGHRRHSEREKSGHLFQDDLLLKWNLQNLRDNGRVVTDVPRTVVNGQAFDLRSWRTRKPGSGDVVPSRVLGRRMGVSSKRWRGAWPLASAVQPHPSPIPS